MRTADDDSVPVPYDAFRLPRAVLNWKTPPKPGGATAQRASRARFAELEPEPTPVTGRDARASQTSLARGAARFDSDDIDDEPTIAIQVPIRPSLARAPNGALRHPPGSGSRASTRPDELQVLLAALRAHAVARFDVLLARAAKLWREGPLRTAAMLVFVALITYLVAGGARRSSHDQAQTVLVPAAAGPAAASIIVEQLNNGARQPSATVAAPPAAPSRGERADRASSRSAGTRTRETSFAPAPAPASKSRGYPAQSKAKSRRAERSRASMSSGSAGLPAWGSEAVREFSGGASSRGAAVTSRVEARGAAREQNVEARGAAREQNVEARGAAREQHSEALTAKPATQALSAKPAASNAGIPPPMAAYRPSTTVTVPVREVTKPAPVVAAKPIEPPKLVAPARPSKPLTMDQVLNQVEEAAQAQRKEKGLKAPKSSKRDAELDELISGSMKKK